MARVAVMIPVRDRAAMVREAIASVLAQTARDYEIVVVDDGSVDGSAAAEPEHALPHRFGDALRLERRLPEDQRLQKVQGGFHERARGVAASQAGEPFVGH